MGKYFNDIQKHMDRDGGIPFEAIVYGIFSTMAEAFDELNYKIDKLGESRDSNGDEVKS